MWGRVLQKDGNCRYKVLKCTGNSKMVSGAGVCVAPPEGWAPVKLLIHFLGRWEVGDGGGVGRNISASPGF